MKETALWFVGLMVGFVAGLGSGVYIGVVIVKIALGGAL